MSILRASMASNAATNMDPVNELAIMKAYRLPLEKADSNSDAAMMHELHAKLDLIWNQFREEHNASPPVTDPIQPENNTPRTSTPQ